MYINEPLDMLYSGMEKVLNEHWRNTVKKFYE
jgi:hypothetical protein